MSSEKNDIRAFAKKHRDELAIDPVWADHAAALFIEKFSPAKGQIVAVYYPIGKEADTSVLVERLWAAGVEVALPVIQGKATPLRFARWTRSTVLNPAMKNIPEPENPEFVEPDILVIPLLAFDQRGYRMGYGQGHYDATLSDLRARKEVVAVGWAYAAQAVLLPLPREDHDQPLDFVVTEQRVFDFRV